MLGKWLGLLKLEVAAQEATAALLGDVAMSSPWVTFSHSAISPEDADDLVHAVHRGATALPYAAQTLHRLQAVCYRAACADDA